MQLQLLQLLLLLLLLLPLPLLLMLLLLGCCCRCCCRSVAILAMPSVRLSTIVCSDDDADEDQDEAAADQAAAAATAASTAPTTTALAMAMAMAMSMPQTEQCNALKFTFHGSSSNCSSSSSHWLGLSHAKKTKQLHAQQRQTDRQTMGKGQGGQTDRETDRQPDRQVGWQAGPSEGPHRVYLHAIKFPGLLLLSQGLCDHIESRFWHFGHNLNLLHFGQQSCPTISSLSAVPGIAQSSLNCPFPLPWLIPLSLYLSRSLSLILFLADIDWEIDSRIVFAELISISKCAHFIDWSILYSLHPHPTSVHCWVVHLVTKTKSI